MRKPPLFLCWALAGAGTVLACAQPSPSPSDVQQLLERHQAGLDAHLASDIDALMAHTADDFVLVNRGEVSTPSNEQRRQFLGPYLAAMKFEYYRDQVPPIVKVSQDGSLAWVIAQVEARGRRSMPDGESRLIDFEVAWIELYERRDGSWTLIGNASTFRDPSA